MDYKGDFLPVITDQSGTVRGICIEEIAVVGNQNMRCMDRQSGILPGAALCGYIEVFFGNMQAF